MCADFFKDMSRALFDPHYEIMFLNTSSDCIIRVAAPVFFTFILQISIVAAVFQAFYAAKTKAIVHNNRAEAKFCNVQVNAAKAARLYQCSACCRHGTPNITQQTAA
jgi:hypothetical protein